MWSTHSRNARTRMYSKLHTSSYVVLYIRVHATYSYSTSTYSTYMYIRTKLQIHYLIHTVQKEESDLNCNLSVLNCNLYTRNPFDNSMIIATWPRNTSIRIIDQGLPNYSSKESIKFYITPNYSTVYPKGQLNFTIKLY